MARVLLLSLPSALVLPALSLNLPLARLILAVPAALASGVKVATYWVSDTALRLLRVPPLTSTSARVKLSPGASLNSNVMVSVCPAPRVPLALRVMATVGAKVSRVRAGEVAAKPRLPSALV